MKKWLLYFAISTQAFTAFSKAKMHDNLTEEMNKLFPPHVVQVDKRTPPSTPTLVEPAFGEKISTDSVTLKWSAVEGITRYHVQIAQDPQFKWILQEEINSIETQMVFKGVEKGKSYFWRVLAVNDSNEPLFTKSIFKSSTFLAP